MSLLPCLLYMVRIWTTGHNHAHKKYDYICVQATAGLALQMSGSLPPAVRRSLEEWQAAAITAFPPAAAWKSSQFHKDIIPGNG